MKEAAIAKAYAKSIYQLGKEQNTDIANELTRLNEVINENNDLETVLFLDVFTPEEKFSVINEIMGKLNLSQLAKNTLNFLITESRIGIFPLIFKNLIVLDDHEKGFLCGFVEGYDDQISAEFKKVIHEYLKEKLSAEIKLEYVKNGEITAGYRVTIDDLQLDASLDNQLNQLKTNILNS